MKFLISDLLDTSVQKNCEEPKSENTDNKFIHPPGRYYRNFVLFKNFISNNIYKF